MKTSLNQPLLDFIYASPTPFHAVMNIARRLEKAGYQRLYEKANWSVCDNGLYYVIRNNSSIIAFKLGSNRLTETGFRMVGAHTDSPCLHVKPQPEMNRHGYWQLGASVYGSVLLAPWFDRELSIAGRVGFMHEGKLHSRLVNFENPIAILPNLAIHLRRNANKGWEINPQSELVPIVSCASLEDQFDLKVLLAEQLFREHGLFGAKPLDYELSFYDVEKGKMIGNRNEFITSGRLDNLLSCFAGLEALLTAESHENCLLVYTDHEEVGSCSACGADGPFLEQVLSRLIPEPTSFMRCIDHSLLVSADNAHGLHPNYPEKHDECHAPLLNAGPVIKINDNQRYATNSITASFFRNLCHKNNIPVQTFVTRNDMACGSTIGPITASKIGVKTVDVGVPTLAMHSIREMAGSHDLFFLVQALKAFFETEELV